MNIETSEVHALRILSILKDFTDPEKKEIEEHFRRLMTGCSVRIWEKTEYTNLLDTYVACRLKRAAYKIACLFTSGWVVGNSAPHQYYKVKGVYDLVINGNLLNITFKR